MSDFIYLSIHTHFSRAGGPASPVEWSTRARDLGYTAIGIADRSPLAGWPALHHAAQQTGISPIYGMEADLVMPSEGDRKSRTQTDSVLQGALLIARSPEGARNLAALASVAYATWPATEAPIPWDALTAHAKDVILILLGGDEAGALQPISDADPKKAQSWAAALNSAFKDSVYIGLPHSGRPGDTALADTIAARALTLSIPLVALPTAHYLQPTDAPAYEALKLARSRAGWPRETPNGSASSTSIASDREGFDYLRAPDEAMSLYAKWPEALQNVSLIAQQAAQPNVWPFATPPTDQGNATILEAVEKRLLQLSNNDTSSPETREALTKELTGVSTWGTPGVYSALSSLAAHASNAQHFIPTGSPLGFTPNSLLPYALGISHTAPSGGEQSETQDPKPAIFGLTLPASGRAALLQQLAEEYGTNRVAYATCALDITPVQAITVSASVLNISGDSLRSLILPALETGWKSLQPTNPDIPPTKLATIALALKGAPLTFTPDHATAILAPRSIYSTDTLTSWSPLLLPQLTTIPWSAEALAQLGYPAVHLPSTHALDTLYAALQLAGRYPIPGFTLPTTATEPDELISTIRSQHPHAYFAGALSTAWHRGEATSISAVADEAHKRSIKIEPPNANFSHTEPTLQRDGTSWSILWGLSNLPDWTQIAASRFISSRPADGFPSLASIVQSALAAGLGISHLTTLIMAGAADTLGDRPRNRHALLSALPVLFEWAAAQVKLTSSTQPDLFAAQPVPPPLEDDLKDDNAQASFGALPAVHPPHVRFARRQWERNNLGISFTNADELDVLVSTLEASGALGSRLTTTASIDATHAGTTIHTVGLLHTISLIQGKDGETLALGHIEDTTGSIELMAFPPNYKRHAELWAEYTLVAVTARVETHPEGDIYLLSEQLAPFTAGATEEAFSITIKSKTPRAAKEPPPPKPAQPLYPSRPDLKIIPPPPPEPVRATPPPMPTGPAAYSIIISIPDADEDQTVIDSLIDLKRLLEQHPGSDNVTIRIPYLRGKWTSANLSRGVRYSHQLETQLSRLLGPDSIAVIQLAS